MRDGGFGENYWRVPLATAADLAPLTPAGLDRAEFRDLADNLPSLCWIANGDGYIVWYNRRWHQYCGTTPEAMEGEGWRAVHDPAILPAVTDAWADAIRKGETFEMVFPLRGADGLFRPFLTRIIPVRDGAGVVRRWIGNNVDISEQQRVEIALRSARDELSDLNATLGEHVARGQVAAERLQLALDAGAILGTWIWDVPMDCFIADDRFARSFGLPPEVCRAGLPLEHVSASIHEEDRARVLEAIATALERGGPYRCEYRVLQHDGVYRWVEASGRVELDLHGRASRFPGVLADIESRRAAEAERDRVTALLRSFTAAVPGVVYTKDRDGRLIVANQGTTDLIGKPPEVYLGKTDAEVLDDKEQAAVVMATDRRIMDSGKAEQVEEEVRLADGRPAIWLSTKAPLFNEAGEVVGLVGSSIDVTARKTAEAKVQELNRTLEQRVAEAIAEREEAQAALRQSQKMEAVGQLTGGLAHDFNNLLAGISGSLELIQTRINQGRLQDVQRYMTAAQGAARRAAALTHRLLAFSRRQTLAPKPTNVNALVAGMEELIRRTIGPAVHLEVVGAAGLWPALVDQSQLENALLNLCINARDAMPTGGRVTIETANRWLDDRAARHHDVPEGQYLSLCVTDNGTGMSPEVMSKAFDPFFTTKPIGEGTGLGLSMIYGFANQSGGQARIYSEVGQGTTVCIYLPRHRGETAEEAALAAALDAPRAEQGETVLIVDDEPTVRMLVADVLGDLGYVAIEAADSASGLKALRSGMRIDLLITDVGLPGGMNGRQMADAARETRPGLRVLFITGYAENAVLGDGRLGPGMHVLTKPFAIDVIASRIREIIAG